MFTLRNMACVYIFNNSRILMMKRQPTGKILANLWAPVGGHMEPDEINQPKEACLREVHEEIGFIESDLENLMLRYITIRRKDNEIRIQYIYFASTARENVTECDEGELHWIEESDVLNLNMSVTNSNALKHYFKTGKKNNDIYLGVIAVLNNSPQINWTVVDNFDSLY